MNTFLIIVLVLAMAATLFSLVRGIISFVQTTKTELNSPDKGPSGSSLKQNRMMFNRIFFQAAAVLIVALILLMNGGSQ